MITPEQVESIADFVERAGIGEQCLAEVRSANPGVHFTYCFDDDVYSGRPVAQRTHFRVYLVDGREHCLKITNSHEAATGLVLAELLEDD